MSRNRGVARGLLLAGGLLAGAAASAGEVAVLGADLVQQSGARWRVSVTLRHADAGWAHYADAWRVVLTDGTVLGTRTLLHPHQDEQPFTRSLDGVPVPAGTGTILIEAHDTVHGWSPQRLRVDLSVAREGRVSARR